MLGRETLAVVVGSPGSGKTRLLQHQASLADTNERKVLLRLRDVREVLGEPEAVLAQWLALAEVFGEPLVIAGVLEGGRESG